MKEMKKIRVILMTLFQLKHKIIHYNDSSIIQNNEINSIGYAS